MKSLISVLIMMLGCNPEAQQVQPPKKIPGECKDDPCITYSYNENGERIGWLNEECYEAQDRVKARFPSPNEVTIIQPSPAGFSTLQAALKSVNAITPGTQPNGDEVACTLSHLNHNFICVRVTPTDTPTVREL